MNRQFLQRALPSGTNRFGFLGVLIRVIAVCL